MRNSERPRQPSDLGLRLLIFALAALLLMALQLTGQLQTLRSAISVLTSPAQLGATGAAKNITDGVTFLLELRTLRQRVAELEEINSSLRSEIFRLNEVERENERMRQILRFAATSPGLELRGAQVVARVIGQESTNFLDYIEVDLGATQGIEVGMPVLTEQGLVGRISEVNNVTAKVLLITDPSSGVNAILQSSRLNGVVEGAADGMLLMDLIPQGPDFSVGEVVLTSGLGQRFPAGIPIGQVVERRQRDIDIFQQAVVQPRIDFSRLELVAIVTNFTSVESQTVLTPVDDQGLLPAGEVVTATLETTTGEAITPTLTIQPTPATP